MVGAGGEGCARPRARPSGRVGARGCFEVSLFPLRPVTITAWGCWTGDAGRLWPRAGVVAVVSSGKRLRVRPYSMAR